MRILHILDHSIPLHSGYAFRTLAILKEQRALGWETFHLTSPKQGQRRRMKKMSTAGISIERSRPAGFLRACPDWRNSS